MKSASAACVGLARAEPPAVLYVRGAEERERRLNHSQQIRVRHGDVGDVVVNLGGVGDVEVDDHGGD